MDLTAISGIPVVAQRATRITAAAAVRLTSTMARSALLQPAPTKVPAAGVASHVGHLNDIVKVSGIACLREVAVSHFNEFSAPFGRYECLKVAKISSGAAYAA